MQLTALLLAAPGLIWLLRNPGKRHVFTCQATSALVVCSVLFLGMFVLWNVSLEITSFLHAQVFPQLHPVYLLVWDLVFSPSARGALRFQIARLLGVLLAFSGVCLAILLDHPTEAITEPTLLGDCISLANGACFTMFLIVQRKYCKHIPTVPFQALLSITMATIVLTMFPCTGEVLYHTDQSTGVLDWAISEHLALICALGAAGAVINVGMTFALKQLGALPVSIGVLVSPVFQIPVGYAWGITHSPGVWACVGGVVALIGVGFITVTTHLHVKASSCEGMSHDACNVAGEHDIKHDMEHEPAHAKVLTESAVELKNDVVEVNTFRVNKYVELEINCYDDIDEH